MVNSPSLETKIKACFCPRTPVEQPTHELPHQNKHKQHLPELCLRHRDKECLVLIAVILVLRLILFQMLSNFAHCETTRYVV